MPRDWRLLNLVVVAHPYYYLLVGVRLKLVLLLTATIVGTFAVASWLRLALTKRQLERQAHELAQELTEDLRRSLLALPGGSDDSDLARVLDAFVSKHRSIALAELEMFNAQYTATPGHRVEIRHLSEIEHGRSPVQSLRATRRIPEGQRLIVVSIGFDPEGPLAGRISTSSFLEPVDRLVRTQEIISLEVTAGAVLLLIALVGTLTDRLVVKPLDKVSRAMLDVEKGHLARRVDVPAGRHDEPATLAIGFNRMVTRLEAADAEIRAFNLRLRNEVDEATRVLVEKNRALDRLNSLLLETQRELGGNERLAALGQLAARLAHEVGTPLGSVSGHLQLAMLSEETPASLRERLSVAHHEVNRVGKIIRDYLDSTRPAQPALRPARLGAIIDEAIALARSGSMRPLDIEIVAHVAPEAEEISTDPALLRQVLVNLITNGLDAVVAAGQTSAQSGGQTASGAGTVMLAADVPPRHSHPQSEQQDNRQDSGEIWLEVRDSGQGIMAEDLARIFEPFYTTKGRGKGTGLGLAICKELTQALGGRLEVTSQIGQGSCFTVFLPKQAQPAQPASGEKV